MGSPKKRIIAIFEALLVTFLWSTSYILIRIGLEEINPLPFAAYRYIIASCILLFPLFYKIRNGEINSFNKKTIFKFLLLGFTGYFIAQGLQFFGLYFLNSVTVTFILNLTPIFVLVFGIIFLKERPTTVQLIGILLTIFGVIIFFYSFLADLDMMSGMLITFVSGLGWAAYMVISRHYLGKNNEDVISITSISMLLGALMLLGVTGVTGNIISVSLNGWIIILWLSLVNTALAFTLWNHALKTLKAVEQSILQNSMLIQITILAFIFLQESITLQKIIGMLFVFIGVLIVQLWTKNKLIK
jgi:drug/metabolite transporter (DMT)-like permease